MDPAHAGAMAVPCTVGAFAAAVLADSGEPVPRDWSAEHASWCRLTTPPAVAAPAGLVHPASVLAAMRRRVPADAVVVNDAGNFSIFGHRYWHFDHPHSQLGPTSGAMGYAVPAAVGAQLAARLAAQRDAEPRRVVALAGDGGFLMTGTELETAARHRVPVVVIVFQNGLFGTIALHQARRLGRTAAVDIGDVDLAAFAGALGAHAVTVDGSDQLDGALQDALGDSSGRPRVVVVRVDPEVLSP
jgi:acetolactate synthase-1/2/3 large subunit